MAEIIAELRKIPPVTRFLIGSSLGVTVPFLMNIVSPYKLVLVKELVFRRLEIWRLYTSFFLGVRHISYLFDLIMLYQTADRLESGSHAGRSAGPYAGRSADFAWQLLFNALSIIGLTLPLNAMIFTRPFLISLIYLSSNLAPEGAQTSIMGLVTIPVKYFPYALIAMDLLMGGPHAAATAIAGAVAGHLWLWAIWGTTIGTAGPLVEQGRAPTWLRRWLDGNNRPPAPPGTGAAGMGFAAAGVHVVPPRRVATASAPEHRWGSGQRLGTD